MNISCEAKVKHKLLAKKPKYKALNSNFRARENPSTSLTLTRPNFLFRPNESIYPLRNSFEKKKRAIISRDKELIIRTEKRKLTPILITTTDLNEQLFIILKIQPVDIANILVRCNICNTVITNIDKKIVKDFVPKKVFENNTEFWFCNKCKKYYWRGSHYIKILSKIDEIKKMMTL